MKKTSTALIFSLLLASLVSCGTEPVNTQETSRQVTEAQSETGTEALTEEYMTLDLKEDTVSFLCRTGTMMEWKDELFVTEDDGDIVNSAIYNRNLKVEDTLNVHLNFIELPGEYNHMNDFLKTIRSSIDAGDHDYDIIAGYRHYMPQLAVEGYFYNLYDVPYIDFTKPWWKGDFTSQLTINDNLYFMAGDIGRSMLKCLLVMFYNNTLAQKYDLETIYDVVKSGNWTIDKAIEYSSILSADLNGDGVLKPQDDQYALSTNHTQEFFDVFKDPFTAPGSDGLPYFTFNNQKSTEIVDKLHLLINESVGSATVDWSEGVNMFREGRVLLWAHCLCYAESMRDMKDDFTVIPYFKWDREQEDYVSATQNNFSIFSVAMNCEHIDAVGAVTELMAKESYEHVTPAYYEVALGTKYARDNETDEMLSIIRNGVTFNFGTIHSICLDGIYNTMPSILNMKSPNFASYYASHESKWNSCLDEIISVYLQK